MSAKYNAHTNDLFNEHGILKLDDVYKLNAGKFMFSFGDIQTHNTRSNTKYRLQPQNRRSVIASQSILHNGPQIWNSKARYYFAKARYYFAKDKILFRESEILFRESEILFRESEILIRKSEIISRESEIKIIHTRS